MLLITGFMLTFYNYTFIKFSVHMFCSFKQPDAEYVEKLI